MKELKEFKVKGSRFKVEEFKQFKVKEFNAISIFTPTLILPRPRDELGICDKGRRIGRAFAP